MRFLKSAMRRWKSGVIAGVFGAFLAYSGWHPLTWRFLIALAILAVYGDVRASERNEASLTDNSAPGPTLTLWKSN